jgi:hypothetical protein
MKEQIRTTSRFRQPSNRNFFVHDPARQPQPQSSSLSNNITYLSLKLPSFHSPSNLSHIIPIHQIDINPFQNSPIMQPSSIIKISRFLTKLKHLLWEIIKSILDIDLNEIIYSTYPLQTNTSITLPKKQSLVNQTDFANSTHPTLSPLYTSLVPIKYPNTNLLPTITHNPYRFPQLKITHHKTS